MKKDKPLSADVANGITLQKLNLDPNDIVIFHIDVGNMAAPQAEEYMMRLKRKFEDAKPFENETMWFAHRSEEKTEKIEKTEKNTHVSVVSKLCEQCSKCSKEKEN